MSHVERSLHCFMRPRLSTTELALHLTVIPGAVACQSLLCHRHVWAVSDDSYLMLLAMHTLSSRQSLDKLNQLGHGVYS